MGEMAEVRRENDLRAEELSKCIQGEIEDGARGYAEAEACLAQDQRSACEALEALRADVAHALAREKRRAKAALRRKITSAGQIIIGYHEEAQCRRLVWLVLHGWQIKVRLAVMEREDSSLADRARRLNEDRNDEAKTAENAARTHK